MKIVLNYHFPLVNTIAKTANIDTKLISIITATYIAVATIVEASKKMKANVFVVIAIALCHIAHGAITVSTPAGGNLDQFDSTSIQWTSSDPNDGNAVSIVLRQGGGDIATLASGISNTTGTNNWTWNINNAAGSNYAIRVISDSDGTIFGDSPAFTIVAPTITASSSNINQLDNLNISWSVTGVLSNKVTVSIAENTQSASITDGSTSYSFVTDTSATWTPGTYTITVTSNDQPSISDTITADISASDISSVAAGNINQFDNLNVTWNEAGTIGGNVTVTVTNGTFTDSKTVTSGTKSATFSTDNTWPADTYTVTVTSNTYGALTSNDTCTISASTISSVTAGNINQFDNLNVTWNETGTIGSNVTVTVTNGTFTDSKTVTSGTKSATFATDNTWPADTYTVTVTSNTYGVITDNSTCTISASTISSVAAGNINQFDNLNVTWNEAGTIGGNVTVTVTNGTFTDSKTVTNGTKSATFSTDNTWPADTYTVTVTSNTYGVITDNSTCTISASTISSVAAGNINQFDNLNVTWNETGTIGGNVTVTVTNGTFTDSKTVTSGTKSATFATDNTWPADTYTVTVTSNTYGALTSNNTCTISESAISSVAAGNINQFDNLNVTWNETGTIGSNVTVTVTNGTFTDSKTVTSGTNSATFSTDNTWPADTYTVTVTSDSYGVLTSNNTCTISTSDISSVAAGNINQFDNLNVTWNEAGTIGSNVTVTVTNGTFTDSKTVTSGTKSATFTTDNTWPADTYTVTVTSNTYGALTSNDTCTISESAIKNVSSSTINQYDILNINWTETGTLGATIQITVTKDAFSQTKSVSAGTLSTSFTTDETWPTGNVTVTVKSVTYTLATATNTSTINPTSVNVANISGINQFDTLSISWTETGTIGANSIVTVSNGGFVRTNTVSTGTLATSFTTDETWPAGTYTVEVKLSDHTATNDTTTFALSETNIALNSPANINQFDNVSLTWNESGSVGANVDITIKLGASIITTDQISSGTGSWNTSTDQTWATGTYTAIVTLTDHTVRTSSQTFTISETNVSLTQPSNINQFDNISLGWSYLGSYGSNVNVEIKRNADNAIVNNQTIASSTTSVSIATDNSVTWTTGTYTATLVLTDHPVISSSKTFTISQTAILSASASVDSSSANQLDTITLNWTTTGSVGNIDLILYKAGSPVSTIATNTSNDGSHSWKIPLTVNPNVDYYLRAADTARSGLVYYDAPLTFDIYETSITVDPVTDITQFDTQAISWSTTGSVGATVLISILRDSGETIATASGVNTLSGSYTFSSDLNWTAANNYYVRVESELHNECYDESTGKYTVNPTEVTLNSMTDIHQLDSLTVTWNKTGNVGTNIIFQLYQGASLVDQQILNTNTYTFTTDLTWTVGTYTVNIISQDHPSVITSDTFDLGPTQIHLTEPVENVYWQAGAQHRVAWISQGAAGPTLTINLYHNSSLISTISNSATNTDEELIFNLPANIPTGVYSIKIISNTHPLLTTGSSGEITITSQSLGGYIYTNTSDPYGSGLSNVLVTITGGGITSKVRTNNMGYWSTNELQDGDYTITPSATRRYFEKSANPDAGNASTSFTLNSSTNSDSHSIMFNSGYSVKFVSAGGSGDGSSWANASGDLQAMLDAAALAPDDRYDEVWVKSGNYSGPITLKNNAAIVGSLKGIEDPTNFNLYKRDFTNNASIITGNGGTGHIITAPDTNNTASINGFTITSGAGGTGTGLYIENSVGLSIDQCIFTKNAATNSGGAITCLNSTITLLNSLLNGNTAGSSGGAIYLANGSELVANNCTFAGNFSPWGGGAIHCQQESSVSLSSCTLASNQSYLSGGIEISKNSSLYMTNSLLYFNSSYNGQTLNSQYTTDGQGTTSIDTCYIQGTGVGDPQFFKNPNSGNSTWGDGDDDYGDLHLKTISPCIDIGNNTVALSYDIDGDIRVYNRTIDIGSDECLFASTTLNSGDNITLSTTDDGIGDLANETYIAVNNTSGGDNNNIEITQVTSNITPVISAYKVVGSTLIVETDLADGDYVMTLSIPFTADDLAGANWNSIVLSYYDTGTSSWTNAGTGTQWLEEISQPTLDTLRSRPLGDYGIYWNSTSQKGFAWVNVNHTTDFAPIIYTNPTDFDNNNITDIDDLVYLIENWILTNDSQYWDERFDISNPKDGIINLNDFSVLAEAWLN